MGYGHYPRFQIPLVSQLVSQPGDGKDMVKRGRPKVKVTPAAVANLKAQGFSFRQIARELGIGASTAHLLLSQAQKCPETPFIKFPGTTIGGGVMVPRPKNRPR